jgi:meso-butanediol dehydrogenase/(S,S)-butanediol dehydrogenase/diacetyl reductase
MHNLRRFTDKVVLITGAGNGIGKATAQRFAAEGAFVVLADWVMEDVERVAAGMDSARCLALHVDVSDDKAIEGMIGLTIETFKKLDVLVNNAGIFTGGSVLETTVADWRKLASVDIDGVLFCSKHALPHLIDTRGCIVNVASVSGLGGDWGAALYNAAKGAVVNLTRAMALDHGLQGVRVNAVCPSLVKTNMTNGWPEKIREKFETRIALGRPGEPEEIAAVIAFLASEDASFITGANLPVDGGATASDGQPRIG